VSDNDACKAQLPLETLDQATKSAGDKWVHHCGWLVVENDLRLGGERARNGNCPLAPGGEAGWQGVHPQGVPPFRWFLNLNTQSDVRHAQNIARALDIASQAFSPESRIA